MEQEINAAFAGLLLRRERLDRDWSQEGLCKGICGVSYLSKIEQGKVRPGQEILTLLFKRLSLPWYGEEADIQAAQSLAEDCYGAMFDGDHAKLDRLRPAFDAGYPRFSHGPLAPDFWLLRAFLQDDGAPLEEALEPFLDRRQLALQRVLQKRFEEALRLEPAAYFYFLAGDNAYSRGSSQALELLQSGYDLAAREGRPYLMLQCRLLMGNVYSNSLDVPAMEAHYQVARRLAEALGSEEDLRTMEYNLASTQLETGDAAPAYAYFFTLEAPSIMDLHKLAICCEKLGKKEEALAALDRAEELPPPDYMDPTLARELCALVRLRLEHPDYLKDPAYGRRLMDCFRTCRKTLPIGYASFHLPWVLEWLKAARQYKQAAELLEDFPFKSK